MSDRELLEAAAKAAGRQVKYDPETGVILWSAKPLGAPDAVRWNARYAWSPAGSVDDKGYIRIVIQVDGKKRRLRAHTLAWFIVYGRLPDGEIDHINQNKRDNRLANLREVTRSVNQRNGTRKGNNTSGVPGVTWHKQRKKWCAQANVDGKHHHLGLFVDKADAEVAAASFRAANGFTETHGREVSK